MALLDTGAQISIISQSFADKISPNLKQSCQNEFSEIIGVSGNIVNVSGCIQVPISIGKFKTVHSFHIIPSHHDIILGLDFLNRHKVKVDFQHHTVTFGKLAFPLTASSYPTRFAKTNRSFLITPNTAESIPVKIIGRHAPTVLLEPLTSFIDKTPHIEVIPSLGHPKHGVTYCHIVNHSSEPIIIPKGKCVALARPTSLAAISTLDGFSTTDAHTPQPGSASFVPKSKIDFDLSSSDLNCEQQQQFQHFLSKNRHVFATSISELGNSDIYSHRIETRDAAPVTQRFYRQTPKVRQEMERQINELLENDIIEPSSSEWRSPVVMVKKKDGSLRFAVDYRKLNKVTTNMSWPLPRLNDIWDTLGETKSQYFTTLDLASGFWQLGLDPQTKHKSSFITQSGQWVWNRLPFGLANSPISYQMAMSKLFAKHINKSVVVYVDDILVFSDTLEQHKRHLQQVF